MRLLVLVLALFLFKSPVHAQDILWKCQDPDRPFRFATSEEKRDEQTPPCITWLEMRGDNLATLLEVLASERFVAANVFVEEAGHIAGFKYPMVSGVPINTSTLYADPGRFGFAVAEPDDAPTSSLVIYDGLAGILVEVRETEESPWVKQVLYPSAARQHYLAVRALSIPGKQGPKVLVAQANRGLR